MMSSVRESFARQPKVMCCYTNPDVNKAASRCTILENPTSPISEMYVHSKTAALCSPIVGKGRLAECDTSTRTAFWTIFLADGTVDVPLCLPEHLIAEVILIGGL